MFAIVTLMNPDGTFDTCGMKNRAPVGYLNSEKGVLNWARRYAKGRTFKVEFYIDSHSTRCYKVLTETTVQPPAQA